MKFSKYSQLSDARVEVTLKQHDSDVVAVFLVLDDYNAIYLDDKTPSGAYATNFPKNELKNAKKFHVEVIRKIPYGTHKHIVSHSSFKF